MQTPELHYTKPEMVSRLLELIPLTKETSILDAGSGRNKVWFNHFPTQNKFECELEDGMDFYIWQRNVDWIIGNPPLP